MRARLSRVRWHLVVAAAVVIYIVTFVLGVALSLPLAYLSTGGESPYSATQAASLISVLLVTVVTGYGALWVARRAGREAVLHGTLVGLAVALLALLLDALFRPITPVGVLLYALMVAVGVLGGVLGSQGCEQA